MPTALADSTRGEPKSVQDALGRILNEVEAHNAPPQLYGVGDWSLLRSTARLSIVGSRKASASGLRRAASLSAWLVRQNFIVLSGLAEGIDTMAHQTAIDEGGRTIGVIGTSLAQSYPASNRELQSFMMREHLVISQFAVGYPMSRANFPRRNRTMALLSNATVIIEAQDGSGTFHQGWEALRLGRPLFIPRSSYEDRSLQWPSEFVKFGACVLEDDEWEPILDYLPEAQPDWLVDFGV